MHTKCLWDNEEKTCYRIEFQEGWTWDDWDEAHIESYAMLGKEKRTIDLIVVFAGKVPPGSTLPHFEIGGKQPSNIRHTVMVNSTSLSTKLFVHSMIATIDTVHAWVGPKFVDSLEEARTYLTKMADTNASDKQAD